MMTLTDLKETFKAIRKLRELQVIIMSPRLGNYGSGVSIVG